MSSSVRVERLLRELYAGPPLRFLEDVFSLTAFALPQIVALREAVRAERAAGPDSDQALV